MSGRTVQAQLIEIGNRSSGFDYSRIILSVAVISWHTIIVCYGKDAERSFWESPLRPLIYIIIPAFFALSGFLVAGSLIRVNNLLVFVTLRVMRIFPALCCEVVISALLIGPLLTTLPLREYFSDPLFGRYFLNVIGSVHYQLPGLFLSNNVWATNLQLWTIPYELKCYIAISVLAFAGITRWPILFGCAALMFNVFGFYQSMHTDAMLAARPAAHLAVACFLWSVFLYLYRYKIPYSALLFASAALATWISFSFAETSFIAALPVAYLTVYLGLQNPKRIFIIAAGDFSYGLYLYGFPIQQAIYQIFPRCRVWYFHLPMSLLASGVCAYLSWSLIESKVLAAKKPVIALLKAATFRNFGLGKGLSQLPTRLKSD